MILEQPMTLPEVASYLRCSERTVREIPIKHLPWVKPGGERLYLPSAVARYVESGAPTRTKIAREKKS